MLKYKIDKSGLFLPVVQNIYIIIDDGGSINEDFFGMTAILLDEFVYRKLNEDIKKFCIDKNITDLHARELIINGSKIKNMDKYRDVYIDLFSMVFIQLEKANYVWIKNFLTSKKTNESATSLHGKLFDEVIKNLRYSGPPELVRKFYSYMAYPTLEILRIIKNCDKSIRFKIIIDQKSEFKSIINKKISLNGILFEVNEAVLMIMNAFINQRLNLKCKIESIEILNRGCNYLIGFVDGYSNFYFNFTKYLLKNHAKRGKNKLMKYNVFKDLLLNTLKIDKTQFEKDINIIKNNFKFSDKKIVSVKGKEVSVFEIGHFN